MADADDNDEAQRRALQQVLGDSSGSDDGEAQRRTLQQVFLFGDSSDSDDDEVQRRVLQQVFGDSSDSDDDAARRRVLQQVFGDSSDSDDDKARRRALQRVFGDSSDSDDDEARRRALQQVLGDSSNSDDEPRLPSAPQAHIPPSFPLSFPLYPFTALHLFDEMPTQGQGVTRPPRWEMVDGIKGLWLCRDFLSTKHQALLMHAIHREGRFTEDSHNQAMRFGNLPEWATELSRCIRGTACFAEVSSEAGKELTVEDQYMEEPCPLPFDLLWREPLFDQLIINVYKPGNICACGPDARFDDGIAIVSLESACMMHFTRCKQEADNTEASGGEEGHPSRIPVYLSPGSLVLMSQEARYLWKHEINNCKPGFQLWEGKEIHQDRRTSVTLGKLRKLMDQS